MSRTLLSAALVALACVACDGGSSSTSPDLAVPPGPPGGPVAGAVDNHCAGDGGMRVQVTRQSDCNLVPDMLGGVGDGGMEPGSVYGPTEYNTEGDDDDCKYHVKWSVSPVYEHYDVNFTVEVTNKSDGSPARSANVDPQVYLSDVHPAPNAPTATVETSPGHYTVGPVRFDASGRWTVRFHFYENCFDYAEDSPHGHAAFYLDVP